VCAFTEGGNYALDDSIHDLEARLAPHGFVRVHRSAMINLAYLAEIHPASAGRARVLLRDGRRTELDVARSRVRELKRAAGLSRSSCPHARV
jgi:DNA-binding LytR/AlgR family response regulator